jgi:hypothetical protein
MRDGKCPFPGCSNHSLDNDADHVLAWAHGGTTGITNLAQPCPKHHRLKHTTGWTPTGASKDKPPGWTSPTGRHYASEQPDQEPPHWPDELVPVDSDLPEDPYSALQPEPPLWPDEVFRLDSGPPNNPYPEPDPELGLEPDLDRALPQDPFPDWAEFQAAWDSQSGLIGISRSV